MVRSFPAVGWYNASKFAVEGLSEALSLEVAPLGIRVILLEPSVFATDWAGNSAAEVIPRKIIADYEPTAGVQRKAFRERCWQRTGCSGPWVREDVADREAISRGADHPEQ